MAIKWILTSLKLYVLCGFHNVMNSEDIYHIETSSPNLQLTWGWEKLITSIENIQRPKQGMKWNIGHVCTIILRSCFQNSEKIQEISTTWNITSPSEVLGTSKGLKEKRKKALFNLDLDHSSVILRGQIGVKVFFDESKKSIRK